MITRFWFYTVSNRVRQIKPLVPKLLSHFFSLAIKLMLLYKEITQFAKSKIIESQLYIDFSLREETQSMKYVEKNKRCISQFLTQHENFRKLEPSISCKKKVKDNLPYRKVSLLSCTLHQVFTKPFYALF